MNKKCGKCAGSGCLPRLIVNCLWMQAGGDCDDHLQHYEYDRLCWVCLGSKRADVFTLLWRWMSGS